jgi:hypothetical protein
MVHGKSQIASPPLRVARNDEWAIVRETIFRYIKTEKKDYLAQRRGARRENRPKNRTLIVPWHYLKNRPEPDIISDKESYARNGGSPMSGLKNRIFFMLLLAFFVTGCGGGGGGGTTGTVVITVADSGGTLIASAPIKLYKVTLTGSTLITSGITGAVSPFTFTWTVQTGDYQAYYVPADDSGIYSYPEMGVKTVVANTSTPFPIQMPEAPPSPPTE